MKNSQKGFTMTEVVIVITLVGVLALLLVPTIKNMLPDEDNIKYKKAFTTIQEIVNIMLNDPNVCQKYNANTSETITDSLQFCNTVAENNDPANANPYTYTPRNLYKEICSRLNTSTDVNCNDYTAGAGYCKTITTPTGLVFAMPPINLDSNFQEPVTIKVNLYGNAVACDGEGDGVYNILIDRSGKVYTESGSSEENLLLSDPQN